MTIFAKTLFLATRVIYAKSHIKQLDMKGIPFLLIVLVGASVVYTWVINKPGAALPQEGFLPAQRDSLLLSQPGPSVGPVASNGIPVIPPKAKPLQGIEGFAVPSGPLAQNSRTGVEAFQSNAPTNSCTPKVVPQANPLPAGAPPSMKPGTLVSAPYGEVASTAPTYYRDPAQQTATRERIVEAAANIRGFLSFEAPLMRGLSDPAVQLPLTKSKADLPRLEQELFFLQQNPGLQSQLKVSDISEIESNVAYLQQKYRLSVNSGLIQRPVSFHDAGLTEGFQGGESFANPTPAERATTADVNSAIPKLQAERTRLSASGTNDPVLASRIAAIDNLIKNLQDISQQLKSGTMLPNEIPITKLELDTIFKTVADPNQPLNNLSQLVLPPEWLNLLPPGVANDAEGLRTIRELIDKYVGEFLRRTSFSFGMKYTSDNEAAAATRINVINIPPTPGITTRITDANNHPLTAQIAEAFGALAAPFSQHQADSAPAAGNLAMAQTGIGAIPKPVAGQPTDPYAYYPHPTDRTNASGFDWKRRSAEICENARKRGLNPADFGCMPAGTEVSPEFSWRGYARMLCNRLQTDYYTGVPEACGCPPVNWPGWNA
jgi:hypothetical protein